MGALSLGPWILGAVMNVETGAEEGREDRWSSLAQLSDEGGSGHLPP